MRRNRIIWFCLWILSLVGITFRGGVISYGIFALLTLIPVFSLLYLLIVYILFHIYQNVERRYVCVNEPVKYRFSLVNESRVLFSGIRVRYFSDFSTITAFADEPQYELMPGMRIEKETTLICKYRGEYDIGIKEIEIEDYFRLFRIRYKNRECVHAVVKPQLVKTDRIGGIELSEIMRESYKNASEPDVLSREYIQGDDRRFINWGQSLRTGTLMTRTLTGISHNEISIITETFRKDGDNTDFIPIENKILETTLALSYYFSLNNTEATEYHYQQGMVKLPVREISGFEEFYEDISEVSFDKRSTHGLLCKEITENNILSESSMVFIVVSCWSAEMHNLVGISEENNLNTVICFVSDDENEVPDLSEYKRTSVIRISPFCDLTGGIL